MGASEITAWFPGTFAASLAPAIFGLLGVLLGGLVTAASNVKLQRLKERAEARGERLDAEAGMRVVAAQLGTVEEAVASVRDTGEWARFSGTDDWLGAWEEERKRIAAAMARKGRAEQFDVVARAFLATKLFRTTAERCDGGVVGDEDREYLDDVRREVTAAADALRAALAAPDRTESQRPPRRAPRASRRAG